MILQEKGIPERRAAFLETCFVLTILPELKTKTDCGMMMYLMQMAIIGMH